MSGINLLSLGNQTSIISPPPQYQYNPVINLVLRPLSDVVDYEWSVITLEYLLILIQLFYMSLCLYSSYDAFVLRSELGILV